MNLQPRTEKIFGQKEFLRNSVGTQYKTGGATLDASAFTPVDGYVKAGTAVYRNTEGFYVPWTDPADGQTREGAGLTAQDVRIIPGSNPVVGVLLAGYPLESKCTGVTAGFKEAVKGYLRFDA